MSLTVAICVHNGGELLREQLTALAEQEWPAQSELLVVDNLSTDETLGIIEGERARIPVPVRVVAATERPDRAYARNVAVSQAANDHVAFCDADDRVAATWVCAMDAALRRHALVTGPLELRELNPAWLAESRGGRAESGHPDYYGIFDCVSGGNMGLRRDLWETVGGFRERFVPEDMEFALQAWRAGQTVASCPEAVVHYRYRTEPGRLFAQGLAYGRGRVAIAQMLKQAGEQRPSAWSGWRSWVWLAVHPPLTGSVSFARWAWVAGNRLGHLFGSVRFRTILL